MINAEIQMGMRWKINGPQRDGKGKREKQKKVQPRKHTKTHEEHENQKQ